MDFKSQMVASMREARIDKTIKNANIYTEEILHYYIIIGQTARLCQSLRLTDSLSVYTAFCYLLWNGYFSQNHQYCYRTKKVSRIIGYPGLNIMRGAGVCLHKSDMLARLLEKSGTRASVIVNYANPNIEVQYRPAIDRVIDDKMTVGEKILNAVIPVAQNFGNHACVLVKRKDAYYIYDPTNLCLFRCDGKGLAHTVLGKGFVSIKSDGLSAFTDLSEMEICDIFDNPTAPFLGASGEALIRDIIELSLARCRDNKELLEDFHREIQSDICSIADGLERKEKRFFKQ